MVTQRRPFLRASPRLRAHGGGSLDLCSLIRSSKDGTHRGMFGSADMVPQKHLQAADIRRSLGRDSFADVTRGADPSLDCALDT